MNRRRLIIALVVLIAAAAATSTPPIAIAIAAAGEPSCSTGFEVAALTATFAADIGPIAGADYQHAYPLSDGRTLWVVQDAFVVDSAGAPVLVHNAGMIEDHGCFTPLVGGTEAEPAAWLAAGETTTYEHWFWPLGGTQLDQSTFRLYLAVMDEQGDHYLANAVPVSTAVIDIDLVTWAASDPAPAPDSSAALYGWSIVDDGAYRYLYAYCNRQFGFSMIGHDECTQQVLVGRQPVSDPAAPLSYWNGTVWSPDPSQAVNVAPTTDPFGQPRTINPMQISRRDDGMWIAVTKVGDWWGDSLFLDTAPAPTGPWATSAVLPIRPLDGQERTNTYFASFVPSEGWLQPVSLSNNCWTEPGCDAYRPTFRAIPADLWTDRPAVPITTRLALPVGVTLEGLREDQ